VLNVLVAQSMGLLLGVAFMNPKTAQVRALAHTAALSSMPATLTAYAAAVLQSMRAGGFA
jgi:hypothetical protein